MLGQLPAEILGCKSSLYSQHQILLTVEMHNGGFLYQSREGVVHTEETQHV